LLYVKENNTNGKNLKLVETKRSLFENLKARLKTETEIKPG